MKGKLKAGLRFPEPSGERWKELVDGYENKHARRAVEGEDEKTMQHYLSAMWIQETQILRALKGDKDKEMKKPVKIRRKCKREKTGTIRTNSTTRCFLQTRQGNS